MNKNALRATAACFVLTTLAACGGGGGGDENVGVTQPTSITAVAGINQNVVVGSPVTLDGSGSAVPNLSGLTYAWRFVTKPAGSNAVISNASSAKPSFTPDVAGLYSVGLVVTSAATASSEALVQVQATAANAAPVAIAGAVQNSVAGSTVTLDGSASSDANGDALKFEWTLAAKPAGSAAALDDRTSAKPKFIADLPGVYEATLMVNDGKVSSEASRAIVNVSIANVAPVANAGIPQNVVTGSVVTLDATKSSDANNDRLAYSWALNSRPAGSNAALNDATSAQPTFNADVSGVYVASLVVRDQAIVSAPATVAVTAVAANAAPVANAGSNQNVVAGNVVTLDGSASSDANKDQISYRWTLTSRPTGSAAVIMDLTSPKPTFLADTVGTYVAQLIVSDGKVESVSATVSVTASQANVVPVANPGSAQSVVTGTLVTLNGSASTDANNDALIYSWVVVSRPVASVVPIILSPLQEATFTPDVPGTYVFQLTVNDGKANSVPSTVTITVAAANAAPIAQPGFDQTVATTARVTLDGSRSTDANGDVLSYAWTFVTRPSASLTTLDNPNTALPSFTADAEGVYVASLTVSDGRLTSPAKTVNITATSAKIELYRALSIPGIQDQLLSLPYASGYTEINGSVLGTDTLTVTELRLKAIGRSYTVENVSASSSSGFATPSFVGLASNQVIVAGQTVTFKLVSTRTLNRTDELSYFFRIKETGQAFNYGVKLRTN